MNNPICGCYRCDGESSSVGADVDLETFGNRGFNFDSECLFLGVFLIDHTKRLPYANPLCKKYFKIIVNSCKSLILPRLVASVKFYRCPHFEQVARNPTKFGCFLCSRFWSSALGEMLVTGHSLWSSPYAVRSPRPLIVSRCVGSCLGAIVGLLGMKN